MVQTSQPWDGTATGDASVAPYSSQEWSDMYKYLFMASKADQGPLLGSGTSPDVGLTVQATNPVSASVEVTSGAAVVEGTFYRSSATETLAIGANASGNARIDTVILRKDVAAQTVRLAVLAGTPAGSPVAPTLTQTHGIMWEIPLADIAVANGFTTIAAADVTPRRHFVGMPDAVYLQDILNNSGGLLVTGDVVIWDTTVDRAITVTTSTGSPLIAGVWVGRTAAGGYGRILVRGVGFIRTSAAVTSRGLTFIQSGTAKQAAPSVALSLANEGSILGISLQTTSGAGLCLAYINVRDGKVAPVWAQNIGIPVADISTTSATFVDVSSTLATVSLTPKSSQVRVQFMCTGIVNTTGTIHLLEFDILRVGGSRAGHATHGLIHLDYGVINAATIIGYFSGLTPGTTYEFRLQFRTTVAGHTVRVAGVDSGPITGQAEELS